MSAAAAWTSATVNSRGNSSLMIWKMNDFAGVVLEHLINVLKRIYDINAPELQSEEAFKQFLDSKPDVFRIAVSCNHVERARLTSPRRASKGLIGLTISTLQELV